MDRAAARMRPVGIAVSLVVGLGGAVGLPIALPLLSPGALVAYQDALGVKPVQLERLEPSPLPQLAADQFGWRELARAVSDVHRALPPAEQRVAVVFGQNYGEAAAVEVHGAAMALPTPPAISGHNNYWLWGIPEGRGAVLLVISDEAEDCGGGTYARREVATKLPAEPWVMPYERALDLGVPRACSPAGRALARRPSLSVR